MSDPIPFEKYKYELLKKEAKKLKEDTVDPPPPQGPTMDDTWKNKVDDRLLSLEKGLLELKGDISGLKIAASALASVVGIGAALLGGVIYFSSTFNSTRIDRIEAKVDTIVPKIADEFRTMRAETAAQTSAIANSITATKQQAPQVILIPQSNISEPK